MELFQDHRVQNALRLWGRRGPPSAENRELSFAEVSKWLLLLNGAPGLSPPKFPDPGNGTLGPTRCRPPPPAGWPSGWQVPTTAATLGQIPNTVLTVPTHAREVAAAAAAAATAPGTAAAPGLSRNRTAPSPPTNSFLPIPARGGRSRSAGANQRPRLCDGWANEPVVQPRVEKGVVARAAGTQRDPCKAEERGSDSHLVLKATGHCLSALVARIG